MVESKRIANTLANSLVSTLINEMGLHELQRSGSLFFFNIREMDVCRTEEGKQLAVKDSLSISRKKEGSIDLKTFYRILRGSHLGQDICHFA